MSIRRRDVTPADHYTIVPNDWLRDERLSFKARGLLAHLMSHRVGWETTVERLAAAGTDGTSSVRSGITELVDAGYLVVERVRDADGTLKGTDYAVVDPSVSPVSDNPHVDDPHVEHPRVDDDPPKKTISSEDQVKNSSAADAPDAAQPKTARGTRIEGHLDDDGTYPVTDRMKAWGRRNATAVDDPVRETAKFVDYWCAQSGQRATMKAWDAAWRTWMSNAQERAVRFAPKDARPVPGRVQR